MKANTKNKNMRFRYALASVVIMAALMLTCVVGLGANPQIPLIFGCAAAGLIAAGAGYSWDEVRCGMVDGVKQSIEAVFILMLIGMLVGVWIAAGTVPSMIYYGLMIVNAPYFLVTAMAVCSVVAFAIGSWGTVGTVGLAFMGIGLALDLPAPLVAGCVVSGAYFGEIVSPLSDATNLTAAVVDRDVFAIIRKTLPVALVAFALTEVAYFVIGLAIGSGGAQVGGSIPALQEGLSGAFSISPWALAPLVIMIACIAAKIPAIPSMIIGTLAGAVVAVGLQGATATELFAVGYDGYASATGNELIDTLLSAGGIDSMMYAISVIVVAMAFGGLMQATGQMEALVRPIMAHVNRLASLRAVTEAICICMNIVLPDQYLGISVPGQMLVDEYDKRHFNREKLSTALLGGGAVTSPLIPWNTCGIYCASILGVSAIAYAPFAVFCLIMPVVVLLAGFTTTRERMGACQSLPRQNEGVGMQIVAE